MPSTTTGGADVPPTSHIAACRRIFDNVSKDLQFRLLRRKVVAELQERCRHRRRHPRGHLLTRRRCWSSLQAHERLRLVVAELNHRPNMWPPPTHIFHSVRKSMHGTFVWRRLAAQYVHCRLKSLRIAETIRRCQDDINNVDAATACHHATHDQFHSLGTATFTCVKCSGRIEASKRVYLHVQALDSTMFEYPIETLRPKLLAILDRLHIAYEDERSMGCQLRYEVVVGAAILIQRLVIVFLLRVRAVNQVTRVKASAQLSHLRRRRRATAKAILVVQHRCRRRRMKANTPTPGLCDDPASPLFLDNHEFLDDEGKDMPRVLASRTGSMNLTPSTPRSSPSAQNTSPSMASSKSIRQLPSQSSPTRSMVVVVPPGVNSIGLVTVATLPSICRAPSPMVYRCYAPRCGGRRFLNKKWFKLHMDKHATAKKRLEDEAAFLERMRMHAEPLPLLLPPPSRLTPPPPMALQKARAERPKDTTHLPSLPHSKPTAKTMVMQLVRLDELRNEPRVVCVYIDSSITLGRSASHADIAVDSSAYPGIVSKQHVRLAAESATSVAIEDLQSRNGTFVNGDRLRGIARRVGLYLCVSSQTERPWSYEKAIGASNHPDAMNDPDSIFRIHRAANRPMNQVSATRKLFVRQLLSSRSLQESRSKYLYRGVELIRAWIQGIVVQVQRPRFAIDDGTGVVWIDMQSLVKSNPSLDVRVGEYVMIIGPVMGTNNHTPEWVQAHQVISLSGKSIQRESLWFLEVVEYWQSVVAIPTPIEIE
ncbi:Aste57867_24269 [Aphanomyces stellatus]|uniref:Aste57867_24269 protein n=1 Tax=Aphanomyces stellatus TaxID=120398 RepID=A0A485LPX0_9STRA|nr:hypothetical protein As57867_024194 [Aphanomyces stellatus]VFU00909.1 Aste57867_24269 [Aphanomyces stellatus]